MTDNQHRRQWKRRVEDLTNATIEAYRAKYPKEESNGGT